MSTAYQRSFAAGEIGPPIYGRTDLVRYQTGLRTLRNMYVMRHGGATNRSGTKYVGTIKDQTKKVRLIPLRIQGGQSYMLELGDGFIRPLKGGLPIAVSSQTITAITKASSAVITTENWHAFKVGDEVKITDVLGMTEINDQTGEITAIGDFSNVAGRSTITVNIDSSAFTAYTSGGIVTLSTARNIEFDTSYDTDDLEDITYSQSYKTLTLAHQSDMPQEIQYISDQAWNVSDASVAPGIDTPTDLETTRATPGSTGTVAVYAVTAVNDQTGEESLLSSTVGWDAEASATNSVSLTWTAVTGASSYNIYKGGTGSFGGDNLGLLNVAYDNSYIDRGTIEPDMSTSPPIANTPIFKGALGAPGMLPAVVGYFQQRRFYANLGPPNELLGPPGSALTGWDPKSDRIIASAIGTHGNFSLKYPIADDSPISLRMLGKEIQEIKHFVDLGKFAVFTAQGEWILGGDGSGAITPSSPSPQQYSYHGCNHLAPIVIGASAIFVQANGSIVRQFGFDYQIDGYKGDDLTIFSPHLVDGYTLKDWAYQQTPHSLIWIVRSDGTLLCLTYMPDQSILGWSRHDFTNGTVESVCSIPEDGKDAVYFVIKRTIDGSTVRYIERLADRNFTDIKDAIFMDAAKTYDGRNTDTDKTMTLSGGTDWDYTETLTLTCSASFFTSDDVGNAIHLKDSDGNLIRFKIAEYTSGTVVTGNANKDVPTSLQDAAVSTWTKAVTTIDGLDHLEGEKVSVIGDGFVIGNPNNAQYDSFTVTDGEIDLGDTAYGVVHVGLPIVADIETLNIDSPQVTMIDKNKLITKVLMWIEASRGIWVGGAPPDDDSEDILESLDEVGITSLGLTELKARYDEGYDDPVALRTGVVEVNIQSQWNSHGRVFARQVDPLPFTALSIAPSGFIPFGGG